MKKITIFAVCLLFFATNVFANEMLETLLEEAESKVCEGYGERTTTKAYYTEWTYGIVSKIELGSTVDTKKVSIFAGENNSYYIYATSPEQIALLSTALSENALVFIHWTSANYYDNIYIGY